MSEVDREKYYDPDRGPDLRKNNGSRRWKISEMWEIHHEITRLLVLGWKNVEIAEHLGVTQVMVSAVRNSPVVQDKLAIMKAARDADTIDVAREIQEIAPAALELLKEIIGGDVQDASIALRAKTAESMLDRAGHGAINRSQIQNVPYYLTEDEIEDLKRRADNSGDIVDVAPEHVRET